MSPWSRRAKPPTSGVSPIRSEKGQREGSEKGPATLPLSTTNTSTLTFGSDATISGGASTDSLYETGSDSTTVLTTGINDYQFADGGVISQSSTYSTNFSATDSESVISRTMPSIRSPVWVDRSWSLQPDDVGGEKSIH